MVYYSIYFSKTVVFSYVDFTVSVILRPECAKPKMNRISPLSFVFVCLNGLFNIIRRTTQLFKFSMYLRVSQSMDSSIQSIRLSDFNFQLNACDIWSDLIENWMVWFLQKFNANFQFSVIQTVENYEKLRFRKRTWTFTLWIAVGIFVLTKLSISNTYSE